MPEFSLAPDGVAPVDLLPEHANRLKAILLNAENDHSGLKIVVKAIVADQIPVNVCKGGGRGHHVKFQDFILEVPEPHNLCLSGPATLKGPVLAKYDVLGIRRPAVLLVNDPAPIEVFRRQVCGMHPCRAEGKQQNYW